MSDAIADGVIAPGETPASVTDRIAGLALRERAFTWWWIGFLPCVGLFALMGVSVAWLFYRGIEVWGNDWPAVWGFDIINYVWWIGMASGGTFLSSLFFLLRAEWRTSLSRIAETMTVFSSACAGIYPILHLGRPWFFYWLFPYPNTMGYWPNFRSPLVWDFIAILTYVVASVLYLYLGLLPDLASVRDRAQERALQRLRRGERPGWAPVVYGSLALGFRGSSRQWRHFRGVYAAQAGLMLPLVISVHSIVGLDFAGGAAPGWHSTQYPPLFVGGAVLSGFGTVLVLAIALRRLAGLHAYITPRHLDAMAKLLLTTSLFMSYCYVMDVFDVYYRGDPAEVVQFHERAFGLYAYVYWGTLILNCALPQLLWLRAVRLSPVPLWLVSFGVIVGMWWERYGIVVVLEHRPILPSAWGDYHSTFWDWALFAGTVGLFGTGFLLFVRFLPMIPMFEMREMLGKAPKTPIVERRGAGP